MCGVWVCFRSSSVLLLLLFLGVVRVWVCVGKGRERKCVVQVVLEG